MAGTGQFILQLTEILGLDLTDAQTALRALRAAGTLGPRKGRGSSAVQVDPEQAALFTLALMSNCSGAKLLSTAPRLNTLPLRHSVNSWQPSTLGSAVADLICRPDPEAIVRIALDGKAETIHASVRGFGQDLFFSTEPVVHPERNPKADDFGASLYGDALGFAHSAVITGPSLAGLGEVLETAPKRERHDRRPAETVPVAEETGKTTIGQMVSETSSAFGMDANFVKNIAHTLRGAGMIRTGGRGLNAAEMRADDASSLLIGIAAMSAHRLAAVEAVKMLGPMPVRAEYVSGPYDENEIVTALRKPFKDALVEILQAEWGPKNPGADTTIRVEIGSDLGKQNGFAAVEVERAGSVAKVFYSNRKRGPSRSGPDIPADLGLDLYYSDPPAVASFKFDDKVLQRWLGGLGWTLENPQMTPGR